MHLVGKNRSNPWLKRLVLPMLVLALAAGLAACGSDDSSDDSSSSSSSGGGKKIALLLPETKTARYESQDKPLFEQYVKEECADCECRPGLCEAAVTGRGSDHRRRGRNRARPG